MRGCSGGVDVLQQFEHGRSVPGFAMKSALELFGNACSFGHRSGPLDNTMLNPLTTEGTGVHRGLHPRSKLRSENKEAKSLEIQNSFGPLRVPLCPLW